MDSIYYNFAEELDISLRDASPRSSTFKNNLSKKQRYALRRLKNRHDIILKPADKGSGVVILNHEQYLKEAHRQLDNDKHYLQLSHNTIPETQNIIKDNVNTHVQTGSLPLASAKSLIIPNPRPGKFYMLPKIHKDINNPPGRPIIATNDHPTQRLSEYVDEHIKEFLPQIPSHIKDTNHFIEICQNTNLPANSRLVTFDVGSLYTKTQRQMKNSLHNTKVLKLQKC
jgi:hypothetical protein